MYVLDAVALCPAVESRQNKLLSGKIQTLLISISREDTRLLEGQVKFEEDTCHQGFHQHLGDESQLQIQLR